MNTELMHEKCKDLFSLERKDIDDEAKLGNMLHYSVRTRVHACRRLCQFVTLVTSLA